MLKPPTNTFAAGYPGETPFLKQPTLKSLFSKEIVADLADHWITSDTRGVLLCGLNQRYRLTEKAALCLRDSAILARGAMISSRPGFCRKNFLEAFLPSLGLPRSFSHFPQYPLTSMTLPCLEHCKVSWLLLSQ